MANSAHRVIQQYLPPSPLCVGRVWPPGRASSPDNGRLAGPYASPVHVGCSSIKQTSYSPFISIAENLQPMEEARPSVLKKEAVFGLRAASFSFRDNYCPQPPSSTQVDLPRRRGKRAEGRD